MAGVAETFCVYHVTAPGMEPGADELPDDFTYPTMDQLSEQVGWIIHVYLCDNSNITITSQPYLVKFTSSCKYLLNS